MGKQVIRVGDPTDHGGKMLSSGASQFKVEGIAVALKGDPCSCPHHGHSPYFITEGDEEYKIGGIPVAYAGHKTTCGATLEATIGNFSKS